MKLPCDWTAVLIPNQIACLKPSPRQAGTLLVYFPQLTPGPSFDHDERLSLSRLMSINHPLSLLQSITSLFSLPISSSLHSVFSLSTSLQANLEAAPELPTVPTPWFSVGRARLIGLSVIIQASLKPPLWSADRLLCCHPGKATTEFGRNSLTSPPTGSF